MNKTLKAWNAGFVRRWHTHPQLCDTVDYDSGHQQRVAILMLSFWSDASRAAIVASIIHDQGECDAGDMARPAKQKHPEIGAMLHDVEMDSIKAQGFDFPELTDEEEQMLAACDTLDCYAWMIRYKPHLRLRQDWKDLLDHMRHSFAKLGRLIELDTFLSALYAAYLP